MWIRPSDHYATPEEVLAVITREDGTEQEFVLQSGSLTAQLALTLFATIEHIDATANTRPEPEDDPANPDSSESPQHPS